MKNIHVREKQQHKTNSKQQIEKVVAKFIPSAKVAKVHTHAKASTTSTANAVANYNCMRKMLKQEDKDIERAVRNLDKYLVNSK